MRISPVSTVLGACLALLSCTPEKPAGAPPGPTAAVISIPPAASPTVDPSAEPSPEPSGTAAAASPLHLSAMEAGPDLVDLPGDTRLNEAARLLKDGKNSDARAQLTKVLPDLDRAGSLDSRMAGHALLGRACAALSDAKCAAEQYEIVRVSWKDPAAAVKALELAGGGEKIRRERLQRALNAVGEAMFAAAEEKRHAADKEKFPAYVGNGDRKSVLQHLQTKVAAWVKARRAAIEEADKAYAAVAQIQPMPPPRWVVASASCVGVMWARVVAEIRTSPIPKEWQGTGVVPGTTLDRQQVRADYYAAMDQAAAPHVATARAAFQTCQDSAQKYGVQDVYSKACDLWLAKTAAPATPAATP